VLIFSGQLKPATLKYNDKASFKTICRQLGIPVVEGNLFEIYPENRLEMKEIINSYLSKCKTVIIRGTLGEAGMSLYKTEGNDISKLYRQIANSGEKVLVIEPFLNVVSMLIRLTHTTLDFVLTPAKCRRSSDMLSVTTS
jgi:hypothetical protein